MSVISWLLLGMSIGLLVNWLVPGRFPGGLIGTIVGGMAGAFLGGALFSLVGSRGVTGFDALSVLVALLGAALLLTLLRKAGYAEPETH